MRQRRAVILPSLVLLTALVGCGAGSDAGDPDATGERERGEPHPDAVGFGPGTTGGTAGDPGSAEGHEGRGTGATLEPGTVVDLGSEADVILVPGDLGLIGVEATQAGDLDGDGAEDVALVVRRPTEEHVTLLAIVYGGPELGGVLRLSEDTPLLRIEGAFARLARVGDMDADGFDDLAVASFPGIGCVSEHAAVHVLYGRAERLGGTQPIDDVGVRLRDDEPCRSPTAWAIGDFDGDDLGDFAVPMPIRPTSPADVRAEVLILYGSRDRLAPGSLREAATASLVTRAPGEVLYSARAAGDVDGDRAADVLLLSVNDMDPTPRWFLFYGSKERFFGSVDIDEVSRPATLVSGDGDRIVGSIGDVDLDGPDDLCLAVHGEYEIYNGDPAGFGAALETRAADSRLGGSIFDPRGPTYSSSGTPTSAGDFDGDGHPDFLLGSARWGDGHGAGLLVLGTGERFPAEARIHEVAVTLAGRVYPDEGEIDMAGFEISAGGDVNADGLSDLLITAPGHLTPLDPTGGRVYLVFGRR